MKGKIILAVVLFFALLAVIWVYSFRINVNFADRVSVRYHDNEKEIDVVVTDKQDIAELKNLVNGRIPHEEDLYCGFDLDVSFTFSAGTKNVTLCPACADACPVLRVNDSNRYIRITRVQRQRLAEILKKYGMELISQSLNTGVNNVVTIY